MIRTPSNLTMATTTTTQTLTYREAAKYCGIDENLLRRSVTRRRVRALKLGHRTVRFRKVDLDTFLDRCATVPA
jgi:excisionase family DNA binding protein